MNTTRLTEEAGPRGVIPDAVQDVIARAVQHFGQAEPTQDEMDVWLTGLKVQAPHFYARPVPTAPPQAEIPNWLSATERLTRFRASQPAVGRARPSTRVLSQEELAELDRAGLGLFERLTRARQMLEQGEGG